MVVVGLLVVVEGGRYALSISFEGAGIILAVVDGLRVVVVVEGGK